MNVIQSMFDSGVFVQKYYGIIEIYPFLPWVALLILYS